MQFDQQLMNRRPVPAVGRTQEIAHLRRHLRRDALDAAEIIDRDPAVAIETEVAGMRIGMQYAVPEHLVEGPSHQGVAEPVTLGLRPGLGLFQGCGIDAFEHQAAIRAQIDDRPGQTHRRIVIARPQGLEIGQFDAVVGLLAQTIRHLGQHFVDRLGIHRHHPAELEHAAQHRDVGIDIVGHAAMADLDDHVALVVEPRRVHLPDGGTGHRLRIDPRQPHPLHLTPYLVQNPAGLLERNRLSVALQLLQLLRQRRRQHVRVLRDHLPELHRCALHLREGAIPVLTHRLPHLIPRLSSRQRADGTQHRAPQRASTSQEQTG